MKFIDIANISVKAGDGGKGHVSFRREKYVPKGGPDGGNGGRGGDIVIVADRHLNTLLDFKFRINYVAENGKPGLTARKTGRDGKDLYIKVPVGTVVKSTDGEIICDLSENEQEFVVAKGGKGGLGNWEFTTATNQAPRYAQPGLPGDGLDILLELKLLADAGIVGFPNVGKSTLISVISEAKPKIADYPFTTLVPNLGMVKIGDSQSYTVADIPGLIEGASEGKGLGLQFLRHVERTTVLLFMIDAWSDTPAKDYNTLKKELYSYNPDMALKKKIICFSKIDSMDPEMIDELKEVDFGEPEAEVLFISSVSGAGIEQLKHKLWHIIRDEKN